LNESNLLFAGSVEANFVNSRRRVAKQSVALGGGAALTDALESVPDRNVGIRHLVDWEITFEHAALDTEFLNAKIEIGRHRVRQLSRSRLD
jgi:hypothetical protein